MMCNWEALLAVLPQRIRGEVDRLGRDMLQELRLRINSPPELNLGNERIMIPGNVTCDDIQFVINAASRYSPWASGTVAQGFLTVSGGHRIGLCGEAVIKDGKIFGLRQVHSLCIRVARDHADVIAEKDLTGSVLILGAPGWGKTTLLRDAARVLAQHQTVCVADERGELFPEGFQRGAHMDVLQGCPKATGIEMLLRTMGPEWIAVDEITAESDSLALVNAANCGVHLLATAHAASFADFRSRRAYRPLMEHHVFDTLLILKRDQTYYVERITG